jgi:hypothetical protein
MRCAVACRSACAELNGRQQVPIGQMAEIGRSSRHHAPYIPSSFLHLRIAVRQAITRYAYVSRHGLKQRTTEAILMAKEVV